MKPDIDPETISLREMRLLGEYIESYLVLLNEVIIFPKEIDKKKRLIYDESIEETRKLIRKLKKGDKRIFIDEEDLMDEFEDM